MPVIRPLPRPLTRILSFVIVLGWAGTMAVLVNAAYFRPSAMLAADLEKYGSTAQWRGVY